MKQGIIITSALMIACFSAIGPLAAKADTDFSGCALPKTVEATKAFADLPLPVSQQMPGLGAADGPILTDAYAPNDPENANIPRTRLAGAFSQGNKWVIVYETGGFSNYRVAAIFALADDKKTATLLGRQTGPFEPGICAVLRATFPK